MDPTGTASETTILWVRHCRSCSRIDRNNWFESPERAAQDAWTCGCCGAHEYSLLLTKW